MLSAQCITVAAPAVRYVLVSHHDAGLLGAAAMLGIAVRRNTNVRETRMSDWYGIWVTEQAAKVEQALRDAARRGCFSDLVAYVMPTKGPEGGSLIVAKASNPPAGFHSVVKFPAQGTDLCAVPYPHIRSLLFNACQSAPVLPVPAGTVVKTPAPQKPRKRGA
jgi:hypothetical protein